MKRALLPALAAACAALALLALAGSPRLLLLNAGLRLQHPWWRAAAAALAALCCGMPLLMRRPRRGWRMLAAASGVALLLLAVQRLRYRIDADPSGLTLRGLAGTTRVGWREVRELRTAPGMLEIVGPGEHPLQLRTANLRPEDRATLERTVARHVREASAH